MSNAVYDNTVAITEVMEPVARETHRLDHVELVDGEYACFCGAKIRPGPGWASHRRGHLAAAERGEEFKPSRDNRQRTERRRNATKKKTKAKKTTPKAPKPPKEEVPPIELACAALVSTYTGSTSLDMEHVELVAGWIDHTRAVMAALTGNTE